MVNYLKEIDYTKEELKSSEYFKRRKTMEYDARIINWCFSDGLIWGFIFDDKKKRFKDETWIHTSTILSKKEDIKEGNIIETKNSKYLLGKEEYNGISK
jgi:hypothetical protein